MKSEIQPTRLHLPSLIIEGYRVFRHLEIQHLGNINLIVGRNNIGKSSLLEALLIYAKRATPSVLYQILEQRDEYARWRNIGLVRDRTEDGEDPNRWKSAIESLFFNRPEVGRNQQEQSRFAIKTDYRVSSEGLVVILGTLDRPVKDEQPSLVYDSDKIKEDNNLGLKVFFQGKKLFEQYIFDELLRPRRIQSSFLASSELAVYVPTGSLLTQEIQRLWNTVTLQPSEEIVITALKLLEPRIERLSYLSGTDGPRSGYPIVKLKGIKIPVPLKSLGEGMLRILGVVLSLVNARDGLLLIDEIDTGLHYSVQDDVWQLIFETARELNVQVFATTHSKETIDSFQRIANKHNSEGMLLSLRARQKDGMIVAVPYAEDELAIATENDIEVR